MKIGCGGSPPKKACSRSGLSLAIWLALWESLSLKECLVDSGSYEGGFFCVAGGFR